MNPLDNKGARRSAFWGDDGNNVDIAQRHAPSPSDEVDAEKEREEFDSYPDWKAYALSGAKQQRFFEYLRKKADGSLKAKAEKPEEQNDDMEYMKNPGKWNAKRRLEKDIS